MTPSSIRGANFFAAVSTPGRIWPTLGAIRGMPNDYDRWDNEFGCAGWGWSEMLQTFLDIEDDVDYGGDGLHGCGGPIPLCRMPFDEGAPFDLSMISAMTELGYPVCHDYHASDSTGISRWALTLRDGQRVSTNDAYPEPARSRPNLSVRGDLLVDRILLDGNRAVGLRTADGEEIAAREVVVSAGKIHSPAILLRSGIGVDDGLAVGANLKYHVATPGFEVALKPAGRMASPNAPVMTSVTRYTSELADAGPNDMQILWFNGAGPSEEGRAGARVIGAVMRVYSKGQIRLHPQDPDDDPVVEFDMLSDERDLVRLRDCTRRIIDVVRHSAITKISEEIVALNTPIDDLHDKASIDEWLRVTDTDDVHAVGTCRMGHPGDPAAVVETDCNVIGYEATSSLRCISDAGSSQGEHTPHDGGARRKAHHKNANSHAQRELVPDRSAP